MSMTATYRDRVARHFRDHPNVWIDGDDLRPYGGKYAYRTRISDCRTELGMTIENRQRRLSSGAVVSEYRFVPDPTAIEAGHDTNAPLTGRMF